MRSVPNGEEKRFYEDNGFVPIDPFLSPEELDEWRRVVDEAVMSRGGQRFSIPVDEGPGSAVRRESTEDREYYDRVFIQRVNLWQTDAAFQKLLFQKELGQFVGEMAGVDGLRVWHDQALIKQPYANPTAFPSRRTVLVVHFARRHYDLDRPRRRHPRERVPVLRTQEPQGAEV